MAKSIFRQTYGMPIPDRYPSLDQFPGLAEYLNQLRRVIKGSIEVPAATVDQLRAFQATWQRLRDAVQHMPPNAGQVPGLEQLLKAGADMAEQFSRAGAFAIPADVHDQLRAVTEASREVGQALAQAQQLGDIAREVEELRETAERAQASIAPLIRR